MKLRGLLGFGCMAVAMAISALPAGAAATLRVHECVSSQPTPLSNTWDFKAEANQTFKYIRAQAQNAKYYSDQLTVVSPDVPSQMSWREDIDLLNHVKADENRIESTLCRLQTIRGVVDPDQQATIDSIIANSQMMADNLADAYNFGNARSKELWVPRFKQYVSNLYAEAGDLSHTTLQAVEQYASIAQP